MKSVVSIIEVPLSKGSMAVGLNESERTGRQDRQR